MIKNNFILFYEESNCQSQSHESIIGKKKKLYLNWTSYKYHEFDFQKGHILIRALQTEVPINLPRAEVVGLLKKLQEK